MTATGPSPELLAHARLTRDMVPHLEVLTELARGDHDEEWTVVELGTRTGASTWALLDGLPEDGLLYSVDLQDHSAPERVTSDPRWRFFCGDDLSPEALAFLPAQADVVFVDTSHEYEQTRDELRLAASLHPVTIALHDALWPGVARAVFEFLGETGTSWEVVRFQEAGETSRKTGARRDYSLVVLGESEW